jgi:hypothetical protein
MLVINTQKAEIRNIVVQGQPQQIVHETLSQKTNKQTKKNLAV